MSHQEFETTLARLYTDKNFRNMFLESSCLAMTGLDLTSEELNALKSIDRVGLVMAANSFHHKRTKYLQNKKRKKSWLMRLAFRFVNHLLRWSRP